MITTLRQNVKATIDLKDGPTIDDLAVHTTASVLTSLSVPSDDVKRAVANRIAEWITTGAPLSDEVAGEIFVAGINRASKH